MTGSPFDCARASDAVLDEQRGRLDAESAAALHAHLLGCERCSALARQERALSELLETKLVHPPAPAALRQKLMAAYARPPRAAPAARELWTRRRIGAALSAAAVLAAAGLLWVRPGSGSQLVVREALNDHLRVLYAQSPIEIESGGIHQVKPWFTGRLDFAPDVSFSGDAEFPLVGGAVGYFVDRKAATFVFKRHLHTISCFVFRAQELPWPRGNERALGAGISAQISELDGFHVVTWQSGDLGHALVSDVNEAELLQLAERIAR